MATLDRREWLKKSALTLAGIGLAGRMSSLYAQEEYTDYIKISSNENPYGPSPMAVEAMIKAVTTSNRYPWQVTAELKEKIGLKHGLSADHVLVGAGSSELLGIIAAYAGREPGNMVAGHPTFKLWFNAAESFGLQIRKIPLTPDKYHDIPAMVAAMDDKTRLVYIVNPHNPTGTVLSHTVMENAVRSFTHQSLLLLDEAYIDYIDEPGQAQLVKENKNLIIAKTFSKVYGMAGARAGYILAHPEMIQSISSWMAWPNAGVSTVSLAGALAALDDHAFAQMTRSKNNAVKDMVTQALTEINVPVIPSSTSFIYYDTSALKHDVAAACVAANIHGVRTYEEGTAWRRTSLGTMAEMERFIDVVRKC